MKEQDPLSVLEKELPDLVQGTRTLVQEEFRKRDFEEKLAERHPNWREVWTTPEFQAFLREEHEVFDLPNYAAVDDAFREADATRAIGFFDSFSKRRASPSPGSSNFLPAGEGNESASHTMTPQDAKRQLVELGDTLNRGQYHGTPQDYEKEEAVLHKIIFGRK